jgi:hypothetical protein
MTLIGEILVRETEKQMEKYQRQATGESVMSLREVITDEGIEIYGADHWKYINEGRSAGGMPPVSMIERWRQAKQRRYGIVLPPAWSIAKKIAREGAPTKKEGLRITEKVINEVRGDLKIAVENFTRLKLFN